jgi:hypothetical protein
MKCRTTNRKTRADVTSVAKGNVVLWLEREGVQADAFDLTNDEAKELAESLLKATGVKFSINL